MLLKFTRIGRFTMALLLTAVVSDLVRGQEPKRAEVISNQPKSAPEAQADMIKKASLLIAYKSTENLLNEGYQLDKEAFLEGVKQAFEKGDLKISDEEAEACLMAYQQHCETAQEQKQMKSVDENKKEGEAYLAKNAQKEGVKKLPSGVQYEVLKSGSGESPKPSDQATVHYHGTLPDGTVFDSSVKKGRPATFPVNGVVAGFSEALQAMKVGDKWRVTIPSELAYGARGPGQIGPNRTLIFEIELLSFSSSGKRP